MDATTNNSFAASSFFHSYGRVTQNWPFALVDYWNATLAPKPEDFTLTKEAVPA